MGFAFNVWALPTYRTAVVSREAVASRKKTNTRFGEFDGIFRMGYFLSSSVTETFSG